MPRSPIECAAGAPAAAPVAARRVVRSGWGEVDGALFAASPASEGPFGARVSAAEFVGGGGSIGGGFIGSGVSGGLVRGGVHEWLGAGGASYSLGAGGAAGSGSAEWSPPLLLLAHLAGCAVRDALERDRPATVLWIGRRVWPYPRALFDRSRVVEAGAAVGESTPGRPAADGALMGLSLRLEEQPCSSSVDHADRGSCLAERSLFVDTGDDDSRRLWAIDTALRSPGVTAIVADGSRLGMAATRRLQLAAAASAERGDDAPLALLARPTGEAGEISAATTRWMVRRIARRADGRGDVGHERQGHEPQRHEEPRWSLDLMRVKGAQVFRPPARSATTPVPGPARPAPDLHVLEPPRVESARVEPERIELRLGRTA